MASLWLLLSSARRHSLARLKPFCNLVIVAIFAILVLLTSPRNHAEANLQAVSVARLSYDRITVRNRPVTIGEAEVNGVGQEIAVGLIAKTGPAPKDGIYGILYDMGYACTPEFDPTTTLPHPNTYGLPKIALIRRGGPPNIEACPFRVKIQHATANGSIGVVVYNNPENKALSGATAALDADEKPLEIPGMLISYEDGMMLRTLLEQTQDNGQVDFFNRVRIKMAVEQRMPVVWEFVLIVLVILVALTFIVSVVLHCRLYTLRQRYRLDAIARGADILPNGTIRMRKVTIDKTVLDGLPVRIFGQDPTSTVALDPTNAQREDQDATRVHESVVPSSGTGSSTETVASRADAPEEQSIKTNTKDSDTTSSNAHHDTRAQNRGSSLASPSLSRVNSLRGSISGKSVKSVRSLRALDAAITLDATAQPSVMMPPSTTPPTPPTLQPVPVNANAPPNSTSETPTDNTCAVCLDDFTEGEEIRTLPCSHEFHCECIDPWLTRKSSTCPLCKYDCLPISQEEAEGRGDDANIIVPTDRFFDFVMGPEWVQAMTMHGHNGTNWIDRIGHTFGVIGDRLRGRPPRPMPGPTVQSSSLSVDAAPMPASYGHRNSGERGRRRRRLWNGLRRGRNQSEEEAVYEESGLPHSHGSGVNREVPASMNRVVNSQVLDEHGQVPLQLITPRGVTSLPPSSETRESTRVSTAPATGPVSRVPEVAIPISDENK
ncbi:hypothetical protein BGW38_000682 [Lunasporangiospora selenospora]|uniref:RING-type domain-containing protein n=1 Tax=Lunasporangiospora selenospora TaxID=979761 RepID=A0A9P6FUY0_9FUNG|nr:hypothetical protein BGW38_000682 [Lunasporangiospora selenospora]